MSSRHKDEHDCADEPAFRDEDAANMTSQRLRSVLAGARGFEGIVRRFRAAESPHPLDLARVLGLGAQEPIEPTYLPAQLDSLRLAVEDRNIGSFADWLLAGARALEIFTGQ